MKDDTSHSDSEHTAADADLSDSGLVPSESASDAATVFGALEAALGEQKDKYLRLAAEYDNFRKRAVRDRQDAELRGMGTLIRGLLDALDDVGRFAHVDPSTVDAATVVQGAEMVEKKLLKSLAGHGLELVNPLDQPFDPAVHEALSTVPAASEAEDHLVAQVYQVGYVFNGQLLRAARVVVRQWKGESASIATNSGLGVAGSDG